MKQLPSFIACLPLCDSLIQLSVNLVPRCICIGSFQVGVVEDQLPLFGSSLHQRARYPREAPLSKLVYKGRQAPAL